MAGSGASGRETTYSTGARHFHWWTVALLAIQVPVGLYMVYRGNVTNFDALTNTLYSSHKLLGTRDPGSGDRPALLSLFAWSAG